MAITAINLVNQTAGILPGTRLPNPGPSILGGVQSGTAAANQFQVGISTSGIPQFVQPSFFNISGLVAATQLPNPGPAALGGIQSFGATASKWINSISTSGVPTSSQPAFSDISGSVTNTQLPSQLFMAGVNAQSGTVYTMVYTDVNKLVTFSNAASIGVTLAQATTVGFTSGAQFHLRNLGAGTVTVTPATSTVDGVTTLVLLTGQGVDLYSDGTNYFTQKGSAAAPVSINFADSETPGGTPNGSLATFTLAHNPLGVSLSLYLNGSILKAGAGNDYTLSGLTITMLTPALISTDVLIAYYRF